MDDKKYIELSSSVRQLLTAELARHYRVLPGEKTDNLFTLYIDADLSSKSSIEELEVIMGTSVKLIPVSSTLIDNTLSKYYLNNTGRNAAITPKSEIIGSLPEDFLFRLIREAKAMGSSDIHLEAYEERSRVRMRIDGMMVERYTIEKADYPVLVNKIKIMANLDIAEKRLPQDGRIFFSEREQKFDIRASIVPTLFGEKVVLRLLSNDATAINLNILGFEDFDLKNYFEGVRRPNGMLLISGPTGSGKTTTLYATLKYLNQESRNILTIEDPIEYTLQGVNQVQLRENIGLNFASAMRTFLRQDPDVIMVGEIRDTETANMAIRASLTGHLVLSTIHTNSAWGTVSRLVDMGVPPFLLANTLNTTVAQRLLRLLCQYCREEQEFQEDLYPRQYRPTKKVLTHFVPKGCDQCYFTGYKGRRAIYEVIPIDAELADKIKKCEFDVTDVLRDRAIKTLTENAFSLFERGDTSFEEIYPLLFS